MCSFFMLFGDAVPISIARGSCLPSKHTENFITYLPCDLRDTICFGHIFRLRDSNQTHPFWLSRTCARNNIFDYNLNPSNCKTIPFWVGGRSKARNYRRPAQGFARPIRVRLCTSADFFQKLSGAPSHFQDGHGYH